MGSFEDVKARLAHRDAMVDKYGDDVVTIKELLWAAGLNADTLLKLEAGDPPEDSTTVVLTLEREQITKVADALRARRQGPRLA